MFAWFNRRSSHPVSAHTTDPHVRPDLDALEDRTTPTVSTITGNFNGTAIPAGDSLWFSSVAKVQNLPTSGATLDVTHQTISFTAAGVSYTLNVPDTTVNLSPSTTTATTTTDAGGDWIVDSPTHFSGNVFLSGLSVALPSGLPGGIKNVAWSGDFTTNTVGVKVNWQWAAAAYTNFASNPSALQVKTVDDNHVDTYQNSDHAGTAENFKAFVVGGGTGGGGSNWTGSYSATASVSPDLAATQAPASISGFVQDGDMVAQFGVQVTLTGKNNLGQSVTMTTSTDMTGAYSFTGLLPGQYTITEAPPLTENGNAYTDSQDYFGQINGQGTTTVTNGTTIANVTLASGDVGTQFNFVNNYTSLG